VFLQFIADPLGVNSGHLIRAGAGLVVKACSSREFDNQRPRDCCDHRFLGTPTKYITRCGPTFFVDVIDAAVDLRPVEADAADAAEDVGIDLGGEQLFTASARSGDDLAEKYFSRSSWALRSLGATSPRQESPSSRAVHFFEHGGGNGIIGDGDAPGCCAMGARTQNQNTQDGGGVGRISGMPVFCGSADPARAAPFAIDIRRRIRAGRETER